MRHTLKQRKQDGFTIIEVLIVLAIAGLILLVVFLAVPALQRNSRNTQRKSEAGALASAYSEYVNNHGGKAPTTVANVTDNAKLGFYKAANVSLSTMAAGGNAPTAPDADHVVVVVNAKCDQTLDYGTNATGAVQYSSRGGAIVYTTEGGTTDTTTCISAN
jgi:prepilin-type N-terminal cleavage/methylation domain-containing protein